MLLLNLGIAMLIILYIVLLILVVAGLYFLSKKIAWFSSKKFFIALLVILLVTGFLFAKLVYKVNNHPSNNLISSTSNISQSSNKTSSDCESYIKKDTIIIGTIAGVMPWSYKDNNRVVGYNISILQKATKLMGKELQVKVFTDSEDLYTALDNKEIDIIADLKPIETDSGKYNYSMKIVDPPFVFIIKEKNMGKFMHDNTSINYLLGFIKNQYIATLNFNYLNQYLTNILSSSNNNLTMYNTGYEVIKSVENDTALVAFVEYFSFLSYKRLNPRTKLVVLSPMISGVAKNGFAFVVNKSDVELKKQLDIALSLLKRRGDLAAISIDYFKEDVTL